MSNYFCHPSGLCESTQVGDGTRIWAFAHVLPGARIGRDCNICDGVFVENDVVIGDRVTIKCGVQLWDGLRLEDDAFVGPNATFTNDRFPRSRQHLERYPETRVRSGASIGANATILPGLTIGTGAMVGAGAVVTRSVPAYAVAVGNPARVVRYCGAGAAVPAEAAPGTQRLPVSVAGVREFQVRVVTDPRGNLTAWQSGDGLPFAPNRIFFVFQVPTQELRGEHAHRVCEQFLVCVHGSVHVVCDDGTTRQEFVLDSPGHGLYIPPMVWATEYNYTPDAVLMVGASHAYDAGEYMRDYDLFLREKGSAR